MGDRVDEFGRTVVGDGDAYRVSEHHRPSSRERRRSNSRPARHDSRDRGYQQQRGAYNPRPRGRSHDRRQRSPGRDAFNAVPRDVPPPLVAAKRPPILSLRLFSEQRPEMGGAALEERYLEYVHDELRELSNEFFLSNMGEEWFQERYDPVRRVELTEKTNAWAAEESTLFRDEVIKYPIDFLRSCSLEPYASVRKMSSDSSPIMESDMKMSGRHLSGHDGCTVLIQGIHASCPRSIFLSAIESSLDIEANPELTPVRMLYAQPVWNRQQTKFERSAWIVMRSAVAAQSAVKRLQDTVIQVPTLDSITGEAIKAIQFAVSVVVYAARNQFTLPDLMSRPNKIRDDLIRAVDIAAMLDELKGVPTKSTLKAILADEVVAGAVDSAVKNLDLVVTYLRRVHFVAYYSGRMYRDEADFLSSAAPLAHRMKEYVSQEWDVDYSPASLDKLRASLQQTDTIPEDGTSANQDELDTANQKSSDGLTDLDRRIYDKKITPLVLRVRNLLAVQRANLAAERESEDVYDAKALTERRAIAFEELVTKKCTIEADGKCRCCYATCNKLFRETTFLVKHLRTKHEDFGSAELLYIAEPFMRKRFDAEDILERPMPPVEFETLGGVESRLVRDILDLRTKNKPFLDRAAGHFEGKRRQDYPRRDADLAPFGDMSNLKRLASEWPQFNALVAAPVRSTYNDVDTPKASIASVDYGVVMPTLKRRKLGFASIVAPVVPSSESKQ